MKNKKFIRENIAWIFMGLLIIVISVILSVLYEVSLEFHMYLSSIVVIIEGIVLAIQYTSYKKAQMSDDTQKEVEDSQEEYKKWQNVREKEDFFALWAHQIKTPIAALNLMFQSEEMDISDCRNEVFKIETYVEMALNYLRFEGMSNDLVLSSCSLEDMVRQVVKKYAPVFIRKHILVELSNLEYKVLTDEKWFCFIVEQILSNALKYTSEGSVKISAILRENELTIIIEDTGIGIRSEDIPRIFEKGFTGYNGRMDKKASGLGLYLTKGVCDKLGHKIKIESRENEGTQVTITVKSETVRKADLIRN